MLNTTKTVVYDTDWSFLQWWFLGCGLFILLGCCVGCLKLWVACILIRKLEPKPEEVIEHQSTQDNKPTPIAIEIVTPNLDIMTTELRNQFPEEDLQDIVLHV